MNDADSDVLKGDVEYGINQQDVLFGNEQLR